MLNKSFKSQPETTIFSWSKLIEYSGGVTGLFYTSLPVAAFTITHKIVGLKLAIWAALVMAVVVLIIQLLRKQKFSVAISGLIGVFLSLILVKLTGNAKNYFLPGIMYSALIVFILILSMLLNRPLIGLIWYQGFHQINLNSWRKSKTVLLLMQLASLTWVIIFLLRFMIQIGMYRSNAIDGLGVTRIIMGYPLTLIGLLVTMLLIKKSDKVLNSIK